MSNDKIWALKLLDQMVEKEMEEYNIGIMEVLEFKSHTLMSHPRRH